MYAQREKVISGTMVDMVQIRYREIELLSKQASGLAFIFGVISSILADSMWTGYYMYYIRLTTPSRLLEGVAALSMFISIFLPLLGLWRCVLLMALAPFKALRGHPADLAAAVDAYREELASTAKILVVTVISIFSTLITFLITSQMPTRLALLVAGTEAIGSSGVPGVVAGSIAGTLCAYVIFRVVMATYSYFTPTRPVAGEYWSREYWHLRRVDMGDGRGDEAAPSPDAVLSIAKRRRPGDGVDDRPLLSRLAALLNRDQSKELF